MLTEDEVRAETRRHLVAYAKAHPKFTAEQAWADMEQSVSLLDRPGFNQKGPLFASALIKPGHVVQAGTTKAANKSAKGRAIIVWKSLLCTDEFEIVALQPVLAGIQADINMHKITVMEGLRKAYMLGSGAGST